MGYAIDHCEERAAVREADWSSQDFSEAVMERVGEIVEDTFISGKRAKRPSHKFRAVEIVAYSIAQHVIENGASTLANDFGQDLERLKQLAVSTHISGC